MKMPKSLDPAYPRVKKENGASGQSESRRLFHNRLKDVCTANVPQKKPYLHSVQRKLIANAPRESGGPPRETDKVGEGTSFLQQLAAVRTPSYGSVPRCTSEWPCALPIFFSSKALSASCYAFHNVFMRFAERWTRAAL